MNNPARFRLNMARRRLILAQRDGEHPAVIAMWREHFRAAIAVPVPPRGTLAERTEYARRARCLVVALRT